MPMRLIIAWLLVVSHIFCSGSSAADAPQRVTCSGKVVDDAGKPVAGAKVTLYQLMPDAGGQELKKAAAEEQITKEDGGFSFSAETLADKQYQFGMLIARKDGFAISWDNWDIRKDKTTELAMSKPYSLRGIVVDDADKPVVGAEVRISMLLLGNPQSGPEKYRYLTSIEPLDVLATATDSKGIFVFNNIPADSKAEFTVKKAGMATISTFKPQQSLTSAADYNPGQYTVGSEDIIIVQPAEARIEGKVVEKGTGKGIGGVRLMCYSQTTGGRFGVKPVVSKDDGTFSFEGLETGTYTIRDVTSREKIAEWVIKPETAAAAAGQTSSGIILEASKGGMLEVTVRDDEKKPVAGVNVYARMNNDDKQGASGLSNSDGIAAIRLAPGEYKLEGAYKEGYSSLREQRTATVEDGKTARLEIELKANPKITGVVRDPDGRPVAGATLRIYPMGHKETNSDKQGKFEIYWNPEQWGDSQKRRPVLVARHREQNLAAVVDIEEDTKTFDVNMSPGIEFSGEVVDSNDEPIAGAKIDVTLSISGRGMYIDTADVTTDQDGRYEYKAIAEGQRYSVSARAEGYGQSFAEVDADDAFENHLEIKPLTLKEAALSISGIVVDVNDKPMANAEVSVSGQGQQYRHSTTDANGKFTIDKLCEGQVYVNANVRDGRSYLHGNISAKAGDTDVKVALVHPGGVMAPDIENQPSGTLEVFITDDANQAVDGARVSVREKDGSRWQSGVSDKNGVASLKLLPGEYHLAEIRKEGYSSVRDLQTVTVEVGKTVQLEVELKANPRIAGVVRDPNGQPVARAAMRVFPFGQTETNSDKQGKFEISWNPEQRGDRELQPVLVVRHISRNLAAAMDIEEDAETFDVNMQPGIVFTGEVVDPNDEPIAGAKINVSLHISGHGMYIDTADVTTDQQGRYEVETIPAGRQYTVSTRVEEYYPGYVRVDADGAVNNHLEVPLLKLKTADMSIAGIAVDANDMPVANARVFAIEDGQQSPDSMTDEQGRFTIDKLCVGQVYVNAMAKDGQTELYGNTTVSAGDTDVIVVVAPPGEVRQPSSKIDPEQFERARKTLATLAQCANKEELEAEIDEAKETVDSFEGGHVIVGRVVLDGPGDVRHVAAQMEILPDGYFAGETRDLIAPVGFRMHRYAPYDLKLRGMKGSLVDVGTIHMTALKEEQLVALKGKVALEEDGDASQAVLYLSVTHGPINTPHNGTSPRRYWPQPIKVQALENGLIEASGFSPIRYYCRVVAPGYLEKVFPVEFNAGQTLDLGTVTLEIPRQILLSYIVATEPPFDLKNMQTASIPAGTKWKALDNKECYGWDLEFAQEKGSIIMKYFYAPCYLRDLGKGEIADYVNIEKTEVGQNQPQNQKAKNEHVYLLHQEHWKRWVLFKVVIE